ncbi:hypothetical protein V2A60_002313 [Cordyceps javanica]
MFREHTFLAAVGSVTLFVIAVVVYRLTLHPLARVPGPLLAATTGAYEAYFQLVKDGGGRYWIEIDRLHELYGPIVRISPWEVHIKDSNWTEIYRLSSRAAKPWWYYRSLGSSQSTSLTEPDQLHRIHRQPLQAWFSSQNVASNIPKVQAIVEKLHDRLAASSGQVVNMCDVYRSLALDVSTTFAFQRPFDHLADPYFNKDFNEAIRGYARIGQFNRYFFGLPFWLIQALPRCVSSKLSPKAMGAFLAKVNECARYSFDKSLEPDKHPHDVVQSLLVADLPDKQKTFDRVFAECRSVILDGNETTATVLVSATYHALQKPEIYARLQNELRNAYTTKGTALDYQELRALPYLTGVINEALRTSNSISGRLVRYSDVADLRYQQYLLPRGTYISLSMNDMQMDPEIFSDPEEFDPNRWLNPVDYKRLIKYLQPWGRGSRLCVGKELAYTDLSLTMSRLFGPDCGFKMKLLETEQTDWDIFRDYFGPMPSPGSKGLRVLIELREKASK